MECKTCHRQKAEADFARHSKGGKLRRSCKTCDSDYYKKYYEKNKSRILKNIYERTQRCLEIMRNEKSKPCADCKRTFPPVCMDFDHVRGKKVKDVARFISCGSVEKMMVEIQKCEVVCSNCHRIRTEARRSRTSSWGTSAGRAPGAG